jgi:hypothetical protein
MMSASADQPFHSPHTAAAWAPTWGSTVNVTLALPFAFPGLDHFRLRHSRAAAPPQAPATSISVAISFLEPVRLLLPGHGYPHFHSPFVHSYAGAGPAYLAELSTGLHTCPFPGTRR